jgi:hypothetical protein
LVPGWILVAGKQERSVPSDSHLILKRLNSEFGQRHFRDTVDMAVTCQVSYTLPVLTIVSGRPSVSRSSFLDRSGGTMF